MRERLWSSSSFPLVDWKNHFREGGATSLLLSSRQARRESEDLKACFSWRSSLLMTMILTDLNEPIGRSVCVCVSAWLLSTVSSAAHHWMHLLAPPTLQRLLRRIHRVLLLKRLLHLPSSSLLQQSSAPCLTKQKVFSTTSPKLSWLIYLISSWLAVSDVLGVISSPEACNIYLRVILSLFFTFSIWKPKLCLNRKNGFSSKAQKEVKPQYVCMLYLWFHYSLRASSVNPCHQLLF